MFQFFNPRRPTDQVTYFLTGVSVLAIQVVVRAFQGEFMFAIGSSISDGLFILGLNPNDYLDSVWIIVRTIVFVLMNGSLVAWGLITARRVLDAGYHPIWNIVFLLVPFAWLFLLNAEKDRVPMMRAAKAARALAKRTRAINGPIAA